MKSKSMSALFSVLTLVAILAIAPSAFAATASSTPTSPTGSSAPPSKIGSSAPPSKIGSTASTSPISSTNAMTADGSVNVNIESSVPIRNKAMTINVKFTDAEGNAIQHINYAITAMQDGTEVLSVPNAHKHNGEGIHITDILASDSPVGVKVTILGIGLPDEKANWTGPKGDVVSLQIVPEFGTIAALVLAISIVSIIAVTAKSRVIPKL